MTREPAAYVGRFAPSPTGPLHFGSLVAAVASYLQAKSRNGRWLLRVEDIDPPREQPGASGEILKALELYGFEWDGDVVYQSASVAAHEAALAGLRKRDLAYPCGCSRRELADAPRGPLGIIYPGTCSAGSSAKEYAIRARTTRQATSFIDALQGERSHKLNVESGDFIVRRRDGLIAYQLAVVVDDELQGVTEVVRGIDLIDSTARQIWLQQLLGLRTPDYVHIPVITHANGDKLSKLTGAPAIPLDAIQDTLLAALIALRQDPPRHLGQADLADIWQWAVANWQIKPLRGISAIYEESS